MPLEIRSQLSDPKSQTILLSVRDAKKGKCDISISSAEGSTDSYRANSKNVKQKLEV